MSLFSKPPGGSLFGQPQQPALGPGPSLFANASQGPGTSSGGLFSQRPSGGLFSSSQQQNAQQNPGSIFGATQQQQQQPPPQQPSEPHIGSIIGQSQSRIWDGQDPQPRQKSVVEQMQLVAQKWNPNVAPNFSTYLYNTVPPEHASFYRPDPSDDEERWEAALERKPCEGAVPVLVRGFFQLGIRMVNQERYLTILQGRLHEVANGLADLLRRHDLEVVARTAACRRTHARLAQRCLALATKAQVLRNRGYVMDADEEALRQKLLELERRVMDPALAGREEEIWARMVALRERGRILEEEFRGAGVTVDSAGDGQIDEEVLKRAKQILEDYDSQIGHLSKELNEIRGDFEKWEKGRPNAANGKAS